MRIAMLLLLLALPAAAAELPPLKVSDNKRFLVAHDGTPFFWLADTGWELFHRLTLAEANGYFATRARQGYTVIQAVAVAEFDGHTTPNANGHLPFENLNPAKPVEAYWKHVDALVGAANARGLYVGFLPTWGRFWHDAKPNDALFTPQNAAAYGAWLGARYKSAKLVWILGGDRGVDTDAQKATIRAMAAGLKRGDGGAHLCTFHPNGGQGSAKTFHADDWLDFNMRQNGHAAEYTGRYDQTRLDYDRTPTKPVLDGEPIYEDHPVAFNAKQFGHSTAQDVRRAMYWDLFGGACGHTYGHHSVWQMWTPARVPINNPLLEWLPALEQPGGVQMQHGKNLLLSRPYLSRIPDDSFIVPGKVPTAVPGAGRYRFSATRDAGGSYAMVYVPTRRPFRLKLDALTGEKLRAWWYDPRTGEAKSAGDFAKGDREFLSPEPELDWVLVIDDAAKGFLAPGTR